MGYNFALMFTSSPEPALRLLQATFAIAVLSVLSSDHAKKTIDDEEYSVFDGDMKIWRHGRNAAIASIVFALLLLAYRALLHVRYAGSESQLTFLVGVPIDLALAITWFVVASHFTKLWNNVDDERRANTREEYGHGPERSAQASIAIGYTVAAISITTGLVCAYKFYKQRGKANITPGKFASHQHEQHESFPMTSNDYESDGGVTARLLPKPESEQIEDSGSYAAY
eukprot:TRINITY_DN9611_c0_g1_i2.p2 TRINITY_DN9611_c0_g1~~TRINITY_DN9611_c0_g1_i2.p2  ORF type:complete len:227 (+),score=33.24 TRINITY_DN9611_c0_g1_i2:1229-1909(+)